MFLIIDPSDGKIIDCDVRLARTMGMSRQALQASSIQSFEEVITGEMMRSIGQARDPEPVEFYSQMNTGEGQRQDVRVKLSQFSIKDVPLVLAIITDVTSSTRAEQGFEDARDEVEQSGQQFPGELSTANRKLRNEFDDVDEHQPVGRSLLRLSWGHYSSLVENSLTGIHINVGGRIVFANERFAQIHGYPREEIMGMYLMDLIHPDDRAMVKDFMVRRFRGESAPHEYEVRGLSKNGQTIWLVRTNTVIDYRGQPAILGNTMDVSKRKVMEQILTESEQQLRVLSTQLLNVLEQERERIAHELHDGIGQYLTAIKFRVEEACRSIVKITDSVDLTPLKKIVPVVQEAVEEVRRISIDLRPSILDDLGIIATIEWYRREFQLLNPGITIEKDVSGDEGDVPEPLKIVIYRIIQEGLNNVVKHSEADWVLISLHKRAGHLILEIKDNGKGFDFEQTLAPGNEKYGFGLASMRKRAELTNGIFEVESRPGEGTGIILRWPLS